MLIKSIALILLISTLLFSMPEWFTKREHRSNDRIFYGYGEGKSEKSARADALREIAEQISSSVSSSMSLHTKTSNENFSQNIDSSTFVSSSQTLKDTKIIKQKQEDGRFFILMQHIYTVPFWYESRSFEAPLFSLIGYGSGLNMKDAMSDARIDISSQISSNISSSTTIISRSNNEQLSTSVDDSVSSFTASVIKESKIIKSERIAKNYFVAISYKRVPKLKCSKEQNRFNNNTTLIQKANRLTECEYDYDLQHINKKWHLYSDGWSQELSDSQFDEFFLSVQSKSVKITSKKSTYKDMEPFELNINSKKDGYLNIIAVYENGKVGLMLENKKIKKETNFRFPHKDANFELIAGTNEKGMATKDIYFAFISKEKMDLARFETLSNQFLGDKEYRFNQVIKLCSKHDFATLLLRTTTR